MTAARPSPHRRSRATASIGSTRSFVSTPSFVSIACAVIVALAPALPGAANATPIGDAPTVPAPAGASSPVVPHDRSLDIDPATVRTAARASVRSSQEATIRAPADDPADPIPPTPSSKTTSIARLLPPCNLLARAAFVVALETACARRGCASSDAHSDGSTAPHDVVPRWPAPTACESKAIRLW